MCGFLVGNLGVEVMSDIPVPKEPGTYEICKGCKELERQAEDIRKFSEAFEKRRYAENKVITRLQRENADLKKRLSKMPYQKKLLVAVKAAERVIRAMEYGEPIQPKRKKDREKAMLKNLGIIASVFKEGRPVD